MSMECKAPSSTLPSVTPDRVRLQIVCDSEMLSDQILLCTREIDPDRCLQHLWKICEALFINCINS